MYGFCEAVLLIIIADVVRPLAVRTGLLCGDYRGGVDRGNR